MLYVCFCKQKTAYEMRISDWSSDVCSSDLFKAPVGRVQTPTLAIVAEREERIRQFVSRDYWEVHATFVAAAGFYTGRWFDPKFTKDERDPEQRDSRLWSQNAAQTIVTACRTAERRGGQEGVSTCRYRW